MPLWGGHRSVGRAVPGCCRVCPRAIDVPRMRAVPAPLPGRGSSRTFTGGSLRFTTGYHRSPLRGGGAFYRWLRFTTGYHRSPLRGGGEAARAASPYWKRLNLAASDVCAVGSIGGGRRVTRELKGPFADGRGRSSLALGAFPVTGKGGRRRLPRATETRTEVPTPAGPHLHRPGFLVTAEKASRSKEAREFTGGSRGSLGDVFGTCPFQTSADPPGEAQQSGFQ